MRRPWPIWIGLILMVGCSQGQPTPPTVSTPVLSGRVGLPESFTNGTPFTASTPFTNSIPAPMSLQALPTTISLAASQSLQVIDPSSGKVVMESLTTPEGRFSVAVPAGLKTAILQVVVRDTKGRIYGLVALATHPAEAGERVISPGSTIVPLASTLSLRESPAMTYGTGFAGTPRPQLARLLEGLSESTSTRAAATFDARLESATTNTGLMSTMTRTAQSLASYATQGDAATPEAIGERLRIALERSVEPTPAPRPTPSPTPWVGRGPAIPLPSGTKN